MKKDILIFGSSRSGKSTLAAMIKSEYNYVVLRLDGLLVAFYKALPDAGVKFIIDDPKNKNIAKFTAQYFKNLRYRQGNLNQKYIIEGDSILPEDVNEYFDIDNCIVIFLVQNKLNVDEILDNYEKYRTNDDWTTTRSDDELRKHAEFHSELGKLIEKQCEKYNYLCFDTSYDRDKVLNNIIDNYIR